MIKEYIYKITQWGIQDTIFLVLILALTTADGLFTFTGLSCVVSYIVFLYVVLEVGGGSMLDLIKRESKKEQQK